MPIVTREANEADADDVADLLRRLWAAAGPDAPGYTGVTDAIMEDLTRTESILERLGGPERRIFLSGTEGGWLGFAATRRIDSVRCELAGILVAEEAAGRGVGTALVGAAADSAAADGAEVMAVSTEIDNARAIAFYEARGFTVVGEDVEDVEDTPVRVVHLELTLEPARRS